MGFTGIVIIGLSLTKRRTDRLFFYLCATVNVTASIAYYSMGSNLGMTPIEVEFQRGSARVRGNAREVFWVRYVDWYESIVHAGRLDLTDRIGLLRRRCYCSTFSS